MAVEMKEIRPEDLAKESIVNLLYKLSQQKSDKIFKPGARSTIATVKRDCIQVARMSSGYRKLNRVKGDTLILGQTVYLGKRDGWILEFSPKSGENLSPDGVKIHTFEIPVSKLYEVFDSETCFTICECWIDTLGGPEIKKIIKEDDYKNDERFSAWA